MRTVPSIPLLWTFALAAGTASAAGLPRIEFDRLVYDFGKTGQVESVSGSFRYRNTGDAVLRIKPPEATCGCTVVSLNPDTLTPDEEGQLDFTLNLGQSRTVLEKRITVRSNDPETPEISLAIKADYTPLYEVTPMILSPALPRNGRATNLSVTLSRTDGKAVRVRRLEPSRPWIQARLDPVPGADPSTTRILVDVQADGPPRRFSEYVHIHDADRTNAPVTMVYVYGQVLGDLAVTPEALYWSLEAGAGAGAAPAGTSQPAPAAFGRRVLIRGVDGKAFKVANPRSTVPDMKLVLEPRENGSAYELEVTLGAMPAQSLAGHVTLETSVATQPKVEIPFVVHVAKP
jgi:hypothetical protein